jgi:hypothetical protein
LGKKKVLSEKNLHTMVLPSKNDVLGIAQKMLGFDRVSVKCQDGNVRICRKPLGLPNERARGDILALHARAGRGTPAEGHTHHRVTGNRVRDSKTFY